VEAQADEDRRRSRDKLRKRGQVKAV
jgi:hypothetical protein